jgi:hypothetical protein
VDGIDRTGVALQKNSALTKWFRSRTENARGTRKPVIVALARKLLIALWRLVREGLSRTALFCVRHNETEDAEGTPTVSALYVRL